MGAPVDFPGANLTLQPPPGVESVQPLRVFHNERCLVSCWELSPEELAEVARTGRVFLSVWGPPYPTFVGGEEAARALVADYGPVWRRG